MARYSDIVRDQNLAGVAGALVTVLEQSGTVPVLYDDDEQVLANPLTTDIYGGYYFNTDPGLYDLKYYFGGRLAQESFGVPVGVDITANINPLSGEGPPDEDLGMIGSTYYDLSDPDNIIFYGPKTVDGWGDGMPIRGEIGIPGGNVMSVGPFESIMTGGITILAGVGMIQTSRWWSSAAFPYGGSLFVPDQSVDAAYVAANPYISFLDTSGVGWRIEGDEHDFAVWGCKYGATNSSVIKALNTDRAQSAMDWGGRFGFGHPLFISDQLFLDTSRPLRYFRINPVTRAPVTRVSKIRGRGMSACGFIGIYGSVTAGQLDTKPLLCIPEGFVDGYDDKLYLINYNVDGTVASYSVAPDQAGRGPATRQRLWEGFEIRAVGGKYCTAIFATNDVATVISNCQTTYSYRGEMTPSAFNVTHNNPSINGSWYNSGFTQQEIEENYENGFGILCGNHTVINNITAFACGTAVAISGAGSLINGARIEVSEQAIQCGTKNYAWDNWNGTTWVGATVQFYGKLVGIATESCRRGVTFKYVSYGRGENWFITGTAGAVPSSGSGARAPAYGVRACSNSLGNVVLANSNIAVSNTLYGAFSGDGSHIQLENTLVTGQTRGIAGSISSNDSASYRAINVLTDQRAFDALSGPSQTDERKFQSFFSNLRLRGLQEVNLIGPCVPVRNLFVKVTIASGATTGTATFRTSVSSGGAAFSVAPAATGSGNPTTAGTHLFAATARGPDGETGIDYTMFPVRQADAATPNTSTYKGVVLTAGQKATMSVSPLGAGIVRRIYHNIDVKGEFLGYWEMVGSTTTFEYTGQAYDGYDNPSGTGNIPDRREIDASYEIYPPLLDWIYGSIRLTAASKATTGFGVTVENAPGSDKEFYALIGRPNG